MSRGHFHGPVNTLLPWCRVSETCSRSSSSFLFKCNWIFNRFKSVSLLVFLSDLINYFLKSVKKTDIIQYLNLISLILSISPSASRSIASRAPYFLNPLTLKTVLHICLSPVCLFVIMHFLSELSTFKARCPGLVIFLRLRETFFTPLHPVCQRPNGAVSVKTWF